MNSRHPLAFNYNFFFYKVEKIYNNIAGKTTSCKLTIQN